MFCRSGWPDQISKKLPVGGTGQSGGGTGEGVGVTVSTVASAEGVGVTVSTVASAEVGVAVAVGGSIAVGVDDGMGVAVGEAVGVGGTGVWLAVTVGAVVTLLEGPVEAGGYTWWRVQTADGVAGWVVAFADEINTLVPITVDTTHPPLEPKPQPPMPVPPTPSPAP